VNSEHRFVSFDETPIFYRRVESSSPRAAAIILHGMGEHGGRYEAFAQYLSEMGIESYLPDLRGFGQSGGRRCTVRRFSDFHGDLKALHAFVERSRKGIPVFIFGHSFGGLIASSYLAFGSPARTRGLILSSPIFGIAVPVPAWKKAFGMAISFVAPDLTQSNEVKAETLTHDKRILEIYRQDPLLDHRISARLYRELVFMMGRKTAIASRIACPALIVQAGDDQVVSKDATLQFYDHLKTEDREIEVYPDFYHEVLNETGREEVYTRIGRWILKRLS
jgi:acylglycerol lipase